MPLLKINSTNSIRNTNTRGTLLTEPIQVTRSQHREAQQVINQITFGDIAGRARTIHTYGSTRLDMQGWTGPGEANLQVQIGRSTVAAVLVSASSMATQDVANQRGVAKAIISALNQSLDSGQIWRVVGNVENR